MIGYESAYMRRKEEFGYRDGSYPGFELKDPNLEPDKAVEILLERLRNHDEATWMHSMVVGELLAGFMDYMGLTKDIGWEPLIRLGQMHDVGKSKIPSEVLNKTEKLTAKERALLKGHPLYGMGIINGIPTLRDDRAIMELYRLAELVSFHHENWNGSGPRHRAGSSIPWPARALTIVDQFAARGDSLRNYHVAETSYKSVLKKMNNDAGIIFDPVMLMWFNAFIADSMVNVGVGGYDELFDGLGGRGEYANWTKADLPRFRVGEDSGVLLLERRGELRVEAAKRFSFYS